MLVYRSTVEGFISDVLSNDIENIILTTFKEKLGRKVGAPEIASWKNSLTAMALVLTDRSFPALLGIAIEYCLAPTGRRIDVVLSGLDFNSQNAALIIELKQWTEAELTGLDGVVRTFLGGGIRETSHPSYQAWTYSQVLQDFNEAVEKDRITVQACAYLHNCNSHEVIQNEFYSEYTELAPAFLKTDAIQFQEFIKENFTEGDSGHTLDLLERGTIRPSKGLADAIASMLSGNSEFTLIDDQKIVFETARSLSSRATSTSKQVLIVEGGPGTGKSVVAINLLVDAIQEGKIAKYVTRNAAPRAVYESHLSGTLRKSRISQLFVGSGSFIEAVPNNHDCLIVDEAHRLSEKSGLFQNLGKNQIKEIIDSSKFSVFFIDEDQRVTFKDIGKKSEIIDWAKKCGATVTESVLASQFRCNGSDGYLAWVDNLLQIRDTSNPTLDGIDYEVVVCDSPNDLRAKIQEANDKRNRSRVVAGYCWGWPSKNNPELSDIVIPDHNFSARWNLTEDGSLWIVKPNSVNEVGCIHTCQGLELDSVGVIFGPDLVVRDGIVITDATQRARSDASVKGYKTMYKKDPEKARSLGDLVIKNTYRTLMTRGQKACLIWSVDEETNAYFREATRRLEDHH
jgi:uncharacterized protein